jgi:hypothetical protein
MGNPVDIKTTSLRIHLAVMAPSIVPPHAPRTVKIRHNRRIIVVLDSDPRMVPLPILSYARSQSGCIVASMGWSYKCNLGKRAVVLRSTNPSRRMREIALHHADMVQHSENRPNPRITTVKDRDGVHTPNLICLDGQGIRAAVLKRFSQQSICRWRNNYLPDCSRTELLRGHLSLRTRQCSW